MGVLLELLAGASASGSARLADQPVVVWLEDGPDDTVIHSDMGALTVHGRSVVVGRPGEHAPPAEATG